MKHLVVVIVLIFSLNLKADISFIAVKDLATWEEMLNLAFNANRNIVVYLHWQGCADCRKLVKSTFSDEKLSNWADANVLALSLDVASEVGRSVANLYQIDNYPTVLLINPGEIRFLTNTGFIGAESLLEKLQKADEQAKLYPQWKKQAAAGTLDKLDYIGFVLIEYYNNRIEMDHPVINDLATMLDSADFNRPSVLEFVQQLCVNMDGPVFKTLLAKPDWITDTIIFNWNSYKKNVYDFNIYRAIAAQDSVLLEDAIYQIGRMTKGEEIRNMPLRARQLYLAEIGHWNAYDTLVMSFLAPQPADSADVCQEEAIFLMENYQGENPNKLALKFLKTGLKKKETFKLYYTLSLWLYQNNDLTNSYKAAYMAENLAQNADEKKLARQMQYTIEDYY